MIVSGTISATGTTPEVSGGQVAIDLTLSAGSVDVEWCVDGINWRPIETFTASAQRVYDALGVPIRLNCTNYSAPINYAMRTR